MGLQLDSSRRDRQLTGGRERGWERSQAKAAVPVAGELRAAGVVACGAALGAEG